MLTAPILHDAFGTALDPKALLAGLQHCGLNAPRLVALDHGFELHTQEADPRATAVSVALTWLRTQLSPLVSVSLITGSAQGLASPEFQDRRQRHAERIILAECANPGELPAAIDSILQRALFEQGAGFEQPAATPPTQAPPVDDPILGEAAGGVASLWDQALASQGGAPGATELRLLVGGAQGIECVRQPVPGAALWMLVWFRAGGARGVAPALVLALAPSQEAADWLQLALEDRSEPLAPRQTPLLLDGLVWAASRRPTLALAPDGDLNPIRVDDSRCDDCGICAQVCPTGYLDTSGKPTTPDPQACIRCFECVDACPQDALRPTHAPDSYTTHTAIESRPGWLSRLRGAPGPLLPAPFPPSYLLPSKTAAAKPRVILGLAVMTMQEHAAALIVDGKLVGAIEEEKLVRIRHYGWRSPGRPPFITPAVDPTLCLEEVLCRRSIRVLLDQAGLTLDDVDLIALNGLHGRFRKLFSLTDASEPIPFVRAGRAAYVPHHLCHAASAFRFSGAQQGLVLSIDGRGDRETAAVFEAVDGRLEPRATILSLTDRSIGGVYEGVTRLLGFGTHGQGSLMALASFGTPRFDFSEHLAIRSSDDFTIHEEGVNEAFGELARAFEAPIEQAHKDLAASVQLALEEGALALLGAHVAPGKALPSLSLAGGVILNCQMNQRLRTTFKPELVFAQPGANDAGTALGAAAEARWELTGEPVMEPMEHASIGPAFDEAAIQAVLSRWGLAWERPDNVATAVAERLAQGEVFCWFQGGLEFGPRALGARSIIADPRSEATKDRVNQLKDRQSWRPFGPSVLAGHEDAWFETPFDSRFMLFTLPVRPERQADIPAVMHVDGTTRPQSVHAHTHPLYHAMISEFFRLTGVPMVLNTSFNRRGEPIVCTPDNAVEAFLALGADTLAIGPFLVPHPSRQAAPTAPARPSDASLRQAPGGRRLSLRLTTHTDLNCTHCMLRDTVSRGDRSTDEALDSLVQGRLTGCDEVVFLRGEVLLRSDLLLLVERARSMGYQRIQIQTHGVQLSDPQFLRALLTAGVSAFEMELVAGEEKLHDEITRTPGMFRPIAAAIQRIVASGAELILTIPILRQNRYGLRRVVAVAKKLGVQRVQFLFPRPVELDRHVPTEALLSLDVASAHLRQAAFFAASQGMAVTTEGFPLCHLDDWLHGTPDATEDFGRHRIDDLAILHDERQASRAQMRPESAPCRSCAKAAHCPKTWALYLEMRGTDELRPFGPAQ